jgi:hypothetical protein
VLRAKALLEPLRDEHQMPADREAVLDELSRVLNRIGHDVAQSNRKTRDGLDSRLRRALRLLAQ